MLEQSTCTAIAVNSAVAVIGIEGYINFDTSEDVYSFITNTLEEHGSRFLVLEVSNVEYVSSAGIGVFMSLQDQMVGVSGSVILVGVPESFRHVLELVGAVQYFVYCTTLQAAREYIAAASVGSASVA